MKNGKGFQNACNDHIDMQDNRSFNTHMSPWITANEQYLSSVKLSGITSLLSETRTITSSVKARTAHGVCLDCAKQKHISWNFASEESRTARGNLFQLNHHSQGNPERFNFQVVMEKELANFSTAANPGLTLMESRHRKASISFMHVLHDSKLCNHGFDSKFNPDGISYGFNLCHEFRFWKE